jgi:hypothetical protein
VSTTIRTAKQFCNVYAIGYQLGSGDNNRAPLAPLAKSTAVTPAGEEIFTFMNFDDLK